MKYIEFDNSRPLDIIFLGRITIDFNPAYNEDVKEDFKALKNVHHFEKFVGGSPANTAVGVTKHGLKADLVFGLLAEITRVVYAAMMYIQKKHATFIGNTSLVCTKWVSMPGGWTLQTRTTCNTKILTSTN